MPLVAVPAGVGAGSAGLDAAPARPACVVSVPSGAAASSLAQACGGTVEVADARTETSELSANADGWFTVVPHVAPQRARRLDGTWGPIDTTLRFTADGMVRPGNTVVQVRLSAGGPGAFATAALGGREFGLRWPRSPFAQMTDALRQAAGNATGYEALARMGSAYDAMLADRTMLLLHLQAFAACGDDEVRDGVRTAFGRMWQTVSDATGLEAVQIKTFMAFGMLLNTNAALDLAAIDGQWAQQARTRIQPGLFTHVTTETNK